MLTALVCVTSIVSTVALAGITRSLQMTSTMNNVESSWSPSSWAKYPIKQPPNYPDAKHADEVIEKLSKYSPLVFAGEVRTLQEQVRSPPPTPHTLLRVINIVYM
jgi:hypothetical protein